MKLFVGICNSQHHVPAEFFWSFINIKIVCQTVPFRSGHPWDVIRNNMIINKFLESDCDILAKMDIDQSYPSNYFERFIPLVEQFKVIGPLIYDRWKTYNYMPLMFSELTQGFMLKKMDLSDKTGIIEAPYAHTNLFYAREVLEKVLPPWYEAYATESGLDRKNHVDYTFLDKIKSAGYPIYIDLSTVVGHMKVEYEVGQNDR